MKLTQETVVPAAIFLLGFVVVASLALSMHIDLKLMGLI